MECKLYTRQCDNIHRWLNNTKHHLVQCTQSANSKRKKKGFMTAAFNDRIFYEKKKSTELNSVLTG